MPKNEPTEGQNACCCSLERAKWVYDGYRSQEMEDRLKYSPIFVYTKESVSGIAGTRRMRRAIVGPVWMTVYSVHPSAGIEPSSYKVDDYIKDKSGELVNG